MVAELYYNLLILYFGKTHRFNHIEYIKTNDITQSSSFTYLEKTDFLILLVIKIFLGKIIKSYTF